MEKRANFEDIEIALKKGVNGRFDTFGAEIFINGKKVRGVSAYKVEQDAGSFQQITLTI